MAKPNKVSNNMRLSLNLHVYPLEAIYQACYVFLDKAHVFLDSRAPDKVSVSLKIKD